MKQDRSLPNEGMEDNNVVYNAKTEGYRTIESSMDELRAIGGRYEDESKFYTDLMKK